MIEPAHCRRPKQRAAPIYPLWHTVYARAQHVIGSFGHGRSVIRGGHGLAGNFNEDTRETHRC